MSPAPLPFSVPHPSHLLSNEPMSKHTAVRLGGPADWLYTARESSDELAAVVGAAWVANVPVRVLGGGANVLVSDAGVRGLIVLNHVTSVEFQGERVRVSAGHSLTTLARKCAARGLAGFEWAASVPGTLGGAVVNNAGAHGGDMAGNLESADVLDAERGRITLTLNDLAFGYRTSVLKARTDRRFLVLGALLRLTPGDPAAISARIDEFVAYRKRTQPPGASLGSIFKNPPGDYAGRLIEACGLKGIAVGGVQVSPVHGNFFIHRGGADAADYSALIDRVQAEVLAQTGVRLEPEIERLGDWA
ncbi:MAG TPA: UDP-N-acetylmuramate dehydrogenase [Candidatus Limnocylindrales bacterium]|nr:UDP-N-acetylmuramate dehydrogenase [Candidatus Limnocylindrales bacterium]